MVEYLFYAYFNATENGSWFAFGTSCWAVFAPGCPFGFHPAQARSFSPSRPASCSLLDGGSVSSLGVRLSSFSLLFPRGSRAPAVLPAPTSTPLQQRALGFSLALP